MKDNVLWFSCLLLHYDQWPHDGSAESSEYLNAFIRNAKTLSSRSVKGCRLNVKKVIF